MDGAFVHLTKKPSNNEWPFATSIEEFIALGWQPLPISEFIIKIHSRCNLACDYCYVYEMDDTSWTSQSTSMSIAVAERTATRIAEHAIEHFVDDVHVIFHGGEPLLVGENHFRDILDIFERVISPVAMPIFTIQTNGLLLTDSMLALLSGFEVRIGVSLDGGRAANNKHRKRRNGAGTYSVVADRLHKLKAGPFARQFSGILATIDVTNNPFEVYEALCAFDPPRLDFLLPHGNWTSPPPAINANDDTTPYADWLIVIFDHWFAEKGNKPSVRLFDQIIALCRGETVSQEAIGLGPLSLATITTDGEYELTDTLKSVFDGAAGTGLNIFEHDLNTVVYQPTTAVHQIDKNALCSTCLKCEVHEICGAGQFAHRYQQGFGFLNPSVYCKDLFKLILHIRKAIES